ncbi:hypothetical protein O9G_002235 [Rozella allomycis CSF55]|uniref:Uncharacterized protein n=1 Tax=Rozella allomycis (strain CSF55) TaxID=988480 RepID=A0A075B0T8_ROZAC|nr:hypothetical protein O9G_002235 [Rozella allomycis CSF55]|eukprot:EPZ36169.1 hypothetical protein O9G_002235 [Rozella allomycis CSF55]
MKLSLCALAIAYVSQTVITSPVTIASNDSSVSVSETEIESDPNLSSAPEDLEFRLQQLKKYYDMYVKTETILVPTNYVFDTMEAQYLIINDSLQEAMDNTNEAINSFEKVQTKYCILRGALNAVYQSPRMKANDVFYTAESMAYSCLKQKSVKIDPLFVNNIVKLLADKYSGIEKSSIGEENSSGSLVSFIMDNFESPDYYGDHLRHMLSDEAQQSKKMWAYNWIIRNIKPALLNYKGRHMLIEFLNDLFKSSVVTHFQYGSDEKIRLGNSRPGTDTPQINDMFAMDVKEASKLIQNAWNDLLLLVTCSFRDQTLKSHVFYLFGFEPKFHYDYDTLDWFDIKSLVVRHFRTVEVQNLMKQKKQNVQNQISVPDKKKVQLVDINDFFIKCRKMCHDSERILEALTGYRTLMFKKYVANEISVIVWNKIKYRTSLEDIDLNEVMLLLRQQGFTGIKLSDIQRVKSIIKEELKEFGSMRYMPFSKFPQKVEKSISAIKSEQEEIRTKLATTIKNELMHVYNVLILPFFHDFISTYCKEKATIYIPKNSLIPEETLRTQILDYFSANVEKVNKDVAKFFFDEKWLTTIKVPSPMHITTDDQLIEFAKKLFEAVKKHIIIK